MAKMLPELLRELFGGSRPAPKRDLYPAPPAHNLATPRRGGPGIIRQAQRYPIAFPSGATLDRTLVDGTLGARVMAVTIARADLEDITFNVSLHFGARGPFPVTMLGQTWEFDPPEVDGIYISSGALNLDFILEILLGER